MLAIVGVAVAVVAGIALSQQKDTSGDAASAPSRTVTRTAPASTPATGKSSPKSSPKSSGSTSPSSGGSGSESGSSESDPKRFPLVVLNNSTVTGLANRAADQFRNGGWTVTSTENLTNDILSTCAYYDPSQKGAKKAANKLQEQFPGIQRVQAKFPELPTGPVVVVLTGNYDAN